MTSRSSNSKNFSDPRGSGRGLIITEKPSVARDIVAALGGSLGRGAEYWENDAFVVSWAVGHLLELAEPDEYDPKFKSWRIVDLPILPDQFHLKPKPDAHKRLKTLRELARRSDVTTLINACDSAREGELIFREVVEYLRAPKPIERIWLQSMLPDAIRSAITGRLPGSKFEPLAAAARCRARSDWLVGMNATRALTLALREGSRDSSGGSGVWSVGRVQTPTLKLLVDRELAILDHEPEEFQRLRGIFATTLGGQYEGVWFDPAFKRDERAPERRDDRLFTGDDVEAIRRRLVLPAAAQATEIRKTREQIAPQLFNLTALQRTMSQNLGWSAKRTLDAAQRCYETHKVLTYPRTESSCLPSDYEDKVMTLLGELRGDERYQQSADILLESSLANQRRVFDDSQVKDHFAIIPTGRSAESLDASSDDARVYDAVARRFIAAFLPPAKYARIERTTIVGTDHFRTPVVETLTEPGWRVVYQRAQPGTTKAATDVPEGRLAPLTAEADPSAARLSAPVTLTGLSTEADKTRPPPRLGEAALLGLMEHAGRQVDDRELAAVLRRTAGLGTAATRAEIIENLKLRHYVTRELRPTLKGITLVDLLQRMDNARLTSAEMTGRLEQHLSEVEEARAGEGAFMTEIRTAVEEIVARARSTDGAKLCAKPGAVGPCPTCAARAASGTAPAEVIETMVDYRCGNSCGFSVPKELHGRFITRRLLTRILQEREIAGVGEFVDAAGKPAIATISRTASGVRVEAVPGITLAPAVSARPERWAAKRSGGTRAGKWKGRTQAGGKESDGKASPRGSGHPGSGPSPRAIVSPCPLHPNSGCSVIAATNSWLCTTRLAQLREGKANPEGFFLPKKLCGRSMQDADVTALINAGRTEELEGFMSKANRPFRAALKLRPDGSAGFEFAARNQQ